MIPGEVVGEEPTRPLQDARVHIGGEHVAEGRQLVIQLGPDEAPRGGVEQDGADPPVGERERAGARGELEGVGGPSGRAAEDQQVPGILLGGS
jgi:hypothetical protein